MTKGEMNKLADPNVPTAWLLIVPIANLVFLWKFGAAVTQVTKGAAGQGTAFAFCSARSARPSFRAG